MYCHLFMVHSIYAALTAALKPVCSEMSSKQKIYNVSQKVPTFKLSVTLSNLN